jgi:hypothetical protein
MYIWQSFVFQYNQINQIRPVQEHYEALSVVNIPLICFFYSMVYNTCIHVCIMYVVLEQFTQNIQIPRQNKITFMILFKHTS